MEKRLIIAIALSLLVMVVFQKFMIKPTKIAENKTGNSQTSIGPSAVNPDAESVSDAGDWGNEDLYVFSNDRYEVTFSDNHGAIKKISLKGHKGLKDDSYVLFNITNPKEYVGAVGSAQPDSIFNAAQYRRSVSGDKIIYKAQSGSSEIIKEFVVKDDSYSITLNISIRNGKSGNETSSYHIIGGSGVSEPAAQDARYVEIASMIDGKTSGFKHPKNGERVSNPGIISWVGLKNRYFSVLTKPARYGAARYYYISRDKYYVVGFNTKEMVIPGMSTAVDTYTIYAGPTTTNELKKVDPEFELSVNYGFFGGIAKVMLFVVRFFYNIFHNWGIAIILLAIFLNIILYPLSMQSFKSIRKMHALHPEMEKLKVQYKDNAQKLNKEMMELYKKHGINPFGGCLPLLLQMPIFIALYQALSKSIELRSAGFLWIKDLSMPDAVAIPVTLPLIGSSINILPLAMVIAMVLQQKMSTHTMGAAVTEEQKQQQKMMLIMMPIIFGFVFYNMPSGLVLYWLVNTVLTIAEQSVAFRNA